MDIGDSVVASVHLLKFASTLPSFGMGLKKTECLFSAK